MSRVIYDVNSRRRWAQGLLSVSLNLKLSKLSLFKYCFHLRKYVPHTFLKAIF